MKLVCPQCKGPLDRSSKCSRCAPARVLPVYTRQAIPLAHSSIPSDPWQHTPGGRILIGVLLALGLCFGLVRLCGATFVALGAGAESVGPSPLARLLIFQGLQTLALLAGGILAGAGHRRGAGLGAIVGVMSGLLAMAAMLQGSVVFVDRSFVRDLLTPGTTLRNITLYGLPVLYAVCGALGGLLGGAVWKPLSEIEGPFGAAPEASEHQTRRLALRRACYGMVQFHLGGAGRVGPGRCRNVGRSRRCCLDRCDPEFCDSCDPRQTEHPDRLGRPGQLRRGLFAFHPDRRLRRGHQHVQRAETGRARRGRRSGDPRYAFSKRLPPPIGPGCLSRSQHPVSWPDRRLVWQRASPPCIFCSPAAKEDSLLLELKCRKASFTPLAARL